MIRVHIPAQLRPLTEGQREATVQPGNVGQVLSELEARYPQLKDRLRYDHTGELRRTVNLYVNGENVRFLEGVRTRLGPGDELRILLAVAGG
jgi:molybdopterin synthase sulfur carrier subunit